MNSFFSNINGCDLINCDSKILFIIWYSIFKLNLNSLQKILRWKVKYTLTKVILYEKFKFKISNRGYKKLYDIYIYIWLRILHGGWIATIKTY